MVQKPRSSLKLDCNGEEDEIDEAENDDSLGNSCGLYEETDMDKIHVTLECKDLWMKFHELGTEMIITKAGRLVINCEYMLVGCTGALQSFVDNVQISNSSVNEDYEAP